MSFSIDFIHCELHLQDEIMNLITEWESGKTLFPVQTSGSTGAPKDILLKREQIISSANRTNAFFNLNENSHVCLCISPSKIGGKMVLLRALIGGYKVSVFPIQANPFSRIDAKIDSFDFVSLVPYQLYDLVTNTPKILLHFKTILLGGSLLSSHLETKTVKAHSNCYIGFGMTETVSHIALRKLGTPYYTCLDGVSVVVENNKMVISDTLLKIDSLESTDCIELKADNTFKWLGRNDFAINSGGIKIHPEEIEQYISAFVSSTFIISGIPDEQLGEKCVLLIEKPLTEDKWSELKNVVLKKFGAFSVPKNQIKAQLIFGENGKILRLQTVKQLLND